MRPILASHSSANIFSLTLSFYIVLNPALTALEQQFGFIPEQLRQLLFMHDGQYVDSHGYIASVLFVLYSQTYTLLLFMLI